MATIIREGGTKVHYPQSYQERIDAIRAVRDGASYAKVDNCTIDLTTANAIVTVYDALSEANRIKFASFPSYKMADIAWKLIK